MSKDTENELLPTRLNAEPSIFRGCSLSELLFLVLLGAAIWIPVWLLICAAFGIVMMGVGLGVLSVIAWVVMAATVLQKIKRGRPMGYYALTLRLWLEDTGLVKSRFIRRGQVWDIGRRRNKRHHRNKRQHRDKCLHRDRRQRRSRNP